MNRSPETAPLSVTAAGLAVLLTALVTLPAPSLFGAELHLGPTGAVQEKVEELDDRANQHWKEIYLENCEFHPAPRSCAVSSGIPAHVVSNWSANANTRESLDLNGDYYISLSYDTNPMLTDGRGIYGGSIKLRDFTKNGVADLAVSGMDANKNPRLLLLGNSGSGKFTADTEPMIRDADGWGLEQSSLAFADFTGDSQPDLAASGRDRNEDPRLILYDNNGARFDKLEEPMATSSNGTGVWASSVALGDMTGNGVPDLVAAGLDVSDTLRLTVFTKEKHSDSYSVRWNPMGDTSGGIWSGDVSLANFTGDYEDFSGGNYMDLAVTGRAGGQGDGEPIFNLYDNRLNIGLTKISTPDEITGLWNSSVDFGDFTGNEKLDLAVSGEDISGEPRLILYENTGNGDFQYHSEPMLGDGQGLSSAAVKFADLSGNGYQDLVVAGRDASYNPRLIVYSNRGDGNFVKHSEPLKESPAINAEGLWDASLSIKDYSGDGRPDLAASGSITVNVHGGLPTPRLYLFTNKK